MQRTQFQQMSSLRWSSKLTDKILNFFESGKFKTTDTAESILDSEDPDFQIFKPYGEKFSRYFRTSLSQYRRENHRGKNFMHFHL